MGHGQGLGIFYLGLHRTWGFVLLIYNIRKQRSHTHTYTRSPQIQTCAFAWKPACVRVGVGEWLRLSTGPCPPMGLVGATPPDAGDHRAGTCATSWVSLSSGEQRS